MTDQITVLVKKSDGSSVRMTLDEVKALKESLNNDSALQKTKKGWAETFKKKPAAQVVTSKSNVYVKPEVAEKPAAPEITAKDADFKSLLEEPSLDGGAKLGETTESQADLIIANLSFKVPADLITRFKMALLLYLKDVRSKDQTKESLTKKTNEGGVGLTAADADRAIAKCGELAGKSAAAASVPNIRELKKYQTGLPAVSTPFNAFEHDKKIQVKPLFERAGALAPALSPDKNQIFKISNPSLAKKVMKDVVVKEPEEFSPVDEIKFFSLTDFRRLSHNPDEAAMRLKQKFVNLKDESVLFYFEAVKNWKESPLYSDYVGALGENFFLRNKISDSALENMSKIQYNEVTAIAKMNRSL